MKIKDLKINFRYLGGNIACLSVDSIAGESIHNDIDNEEAIIIFNSLVGEKENCQTVKTLLKENQELKSKISNMKESYETDAEAKFYDYLGEHENELEKEQLNNLVNSCQEEIRQLKKQLEGVREEREYLFNKLNTENKWLLVENKELETQQKEFIKYYGNNWIGDDK